jgi:hypothetical protein
MIVPVLLASFDTLKAFAVTFPNVPASERDYIRIILLIASALAGPLNA